MMSVSESCSDCGADLDELPPGTPCQVCGGQRRNLTIRTTPAIAVAIGGPTTVTWTYGAEAPWHVRWVDIEGRLAELETFCQTSDTSVDLRRMVEDVLKACRELGDWLWEDRANTKLSKEAVMKFIKNNQASIICDGLAQTSKHNRRSNSNSITAWIFDVVSGRAIIHWYQDDPDTVEELDGLDLCRDSVTAWHQFLTDPDR